MSLVEDRKRYYSSFTKKLFIYLHNFLFWIMRPTRYLVGYVIQKRSILLLATDILRHGWTRGFHTGLSSLCFPTEQRRTRPISYMWGISGMHTGLKTGKKCATRNFFFRSLLLSFIFFALFFFLNF